MCLFMLFLFFRGASYFRFVSLFAISHFACLSFVLRLLGFSTAVFSWKFHYLVLLSLRFWQAALMVNYRVKLVNFISTIDGRAYFIRLNANLLSFNHWIPSSHDGTRMSNVEVLANWKCDLISISGDRGANSECNSVAFVFQEFFEHFGLRENRSVFKEITRTLNKFWRKTLCDD